MNLIYDTKPKQILIYASSGEHLTEGKSGGSVKQTVNFSKNSALSTAAETKYSSESNATVIQLFGDFSRLFPSIQKKLRKQDVPYYRRLLLTVRPHRQQFCFLARKCSGLSLEELCERLNQHPKILKLNSYPSFKSFYPITPESLSNLEKDISRVMEYCKSGFLFGAGTPTEEIANAIAEICDVTEEYELFVDRKSVV